MKQTTITITVTGQGREDFVRYVDYLCKTSHADGLTVIYAADEEDIEVPLKPVVSSKPRMIWD